LASVIVSRGKPFRLSNLSAFAMNFLVLNLIRETREKLE